MNKFQRISLIYFASSCFFLASGYSLIFNTSSFDSWIAMIIGSVIGLVIVVISNKFGFNKVKSYILNSHLKLPSRIIFTLFFSFIVFVNITILRVFTTSFYLTKTPGWFIIIPFLLLCVYNSSKGIKTIAKEAQILMPISIVFIVLNMLGVCSDGNLDNFLPILYNPMSNILISSLYFAIFTAIPPLILFDTKISIKDNIKGYLLSAFILIFVGIIIIFVLGPNLIQIYRFPEYMVLKQLKLFNFVEKIENLVGMIWFFNLFITSSISLYNIDKTVKNTKTRFLLYVSLTLLIECFAYHYELVLFIYKNMPYLLLAFGFIFFITIFLQKRKNSC